MVTVAKINLLGWLVLGIGLVVIAYGLLMVFLAWRMPAPSRGPSRSRAGAPRSRGMAGPPAAPAG